MATAIEYGLIAAGISVAIIGVVTTVGEKLNSPVTAAKVPVSKVKPIGYRPIVRNDGHEMLVNVGWIDGYKYVINPCKTPDINEQNEVNVAWLESKWFKGYMTFCK